MLELTAWDSFLETVYPVELPRHEGVRPSVMGRYRASSGVGRGPQLDSCRTNPPLTTLQALVLEREGRVALVATGKWRPLNAFNAAAQLHSDIFVMIPSFRPISCDLFPISQVCRRRRTILVSSPLLWRRIDCQSLTRTVFSLERHLPVPLRLELYDGFSDGAFDAVSNHGSKITSISAHLQFDQL